MPIRNPMMGYEPNPERPGEMIGYFQDNTSVSAPVAVIEKAYRDSEEQRKQAMLADASRSLMPGLSQMASDAQRGSLPSRISVQGGGQQSPGLDWGSATADPGSGSPGTQKAPPAPKWKGNATPQGELDWNNATADTRQPAPIAQPKPSQKKGEPTTPSPGKQQVAPGGRSPELQLSDADKVRNAMVANLNDQALAAALARRVGGRAKFDPKAYDESLSAVRDKQLVETTGAKPFDPEAWGKIWQKEQEAQRLQQYHDEAILENEAEAAKLDTYQSQQLLEEAQQQQRANEVAFYQEYDALKQEVHDAANAKVDPDRWSKGRGFFKDAALVIGVALQGLATRGQNSGLLEMVQRRINEDVAIQTAQIERKGAAAENQLARLSHRWGSLQAGQAALRVQAMEVAKLRIQSMKAGGQNQAFEDAKLAAVSGLEAQQGREMEALKAGAIGEIATRTESKFMAPHAASSGYADPMGQLKAIAAWLQNEKGLGESESIDIANQILAKGGHGPKEQVRYDIKNQDSQKELGFQLAPMEADRNRIQRLLTQMGAKFDKEGMVTSVNDKQSVWKTGLTSMLEGLSPGLSQMFWSAIDPVTGEIDRAKQAIADQRLKELSGVAFTEPEVVRNLWSLGSAAASGPEAMANAMNRMVQVQDDKIQGYLASVPREVADNYRRRRQEERDLSQQQKNLSNEIRPE